MTDCMKFMIHCPEYFGYFVVWKFSLFWGTLLCVTKWMSCIRSLVWESSQPCAQSSGMPCGTVPCLAAWERGNLFSVWESEFPSLFLLSFHSMLCVVFCYSLSCNTSYMSPGVKSLCQLLNQEFSCCLSGPGKIPGNRLYIGLDSGLPGRIAIRKLVLTSTPRWQLGEQHIRGTAAGKKLGSLWWWVRCSWGTDVKGRRWQK